MTPVKRSARSYQTVVGFLCLTSILLTISSCAALQTSRARDLYVDPDHQEELGEARFDLEEVTIRSPASGTAIRSNAQYIYRLVLSRHNSRTDGDTLLIRAALQEQPFVRGFETRNTISVETRVYRPGESEPFAYSLYSEETVNTLTSYSHLYRVIQASVSPLLK